MIIWVIWWLFDWLIDWLFDDYLWIFVFDYLIILKIIWWLSEWTYRYRASPCADARRHARSPGLLYSFVNTVVVIKSTWPRKCAAVQNHLLNQQKSEPRPVLGLIGSGSERIDSSIRAQVQHSTGYLVWFRIDKKLVDHAFCIVQTNHWDDGHHCVIVAKISLHFFVL